MKHSHSILVLTAILSTLLTTTTYAAQKTKASKSNEATYNAREKCITDTIAALPGTPTDTNGLSARRMSMYSDCAKRMGFRP